MMTLEDAIIKAVIIACGLDRTQIVGWLENDWVIRDREDPESEQLKEQIEVNGSGVVKVK